MGGGPAPRWVTHVLHAFAKCSSSRFHRFGRALLHAGGDHAVAIFDRLEDSDRREPRPAAQIREGRGLERHVSGTPSNSSPRRRHRKRRMRAFLAGLRHDIFRTIRDRLARGIADGDLTASPAGLDAIARYYTTMVQGLSVQARDGASRADLEAVITCAMAAWDMLATADR